MIVQIFIVRMIPATLGSAHFTPGSSIATSTGTGWGSTAPPPVATALPAPARTTLATLSPAPPGRATASQRMRTSKTGSGPGALTLASKIISSNHLLKLIMIVSSVCKCCSERKDNEEFSQYCVGWKDQGWVSGFFSRNISGLFLSSVRFCDSGSYVAWMNINCQKSCTCRGKV